MLDRHRIDENKAEQEGLRGKLEHDPVLAVGKETQEDGKGSTGSDPRNDRSNIGSVLPFGALVQQTTLFTQHGAGSRAPRQRRVHHVPRGPILASCTGLRFRARHGFRREPDAPVLNDARLRPGAPHRQGARARVSGVRGAQRGHAPPQPFLHPDPMSSLRADVRAATGGQPSKAAQPHRGWIGAPIRKARLLKGMD